MEILRTSLMICTHSTLVCLFFAFSNYLDTLEWKAISTNGTKATPRAYGQATFVGNDTSNIYFFGGYFRDNLQVNYEYLNTQLSCSY